MCALKKMELMGIKTETTRLLSAQSPQVLQLALAGMYRAKAALSREPWDYGAERNILHGVDPIWGIIPKSWDTEDYIDGEILEHFRCEILLPQRNSWDCLVLLELSLPAVHVKRGVTHNASPDVVVFPYIMRQNIIAAYTLEDSLLPSCMEGLVPRWYFKTVKSIYNSLVVGAPLFPECIDFAQEYLRVGEEKYNA